MIKPTDTVLAIAWTIRGGLLATAIISCVLLGTVGENPTWMYPTLVVLTLVNMVGVFIVEKKPKQPRGQLTQPVPEQPAPYAVAPHRAGDLR